MKKQFFYAAMAVALMASCTSEDNLTVDPVNPTPDEEKVAIELGVNTPNILASSRGTGTVGGVQNETTAVNGWNNQVLNIIMVDANGGYAQDETGAGYIFKDLTFNAPYNDATGEDSDNIRIYSAPGLFQHKYYSFFFKIQVKK